MLDLQKLRCFVAVAETLNVGKAAARLHMSQSPLSRQIIALEEQICVELFKRDQKKMRLTAAGTRFLVEARALLEHASQLEIRMGDEARGLTGVLTVGFVEGAVHIGALPEALRSFQKGAPKATIELRNMRSHQQFEALKFGGIDLGFSYSKPSRREPLNATKVAEEGFFLAIPQGHSCIQGGLDLAELDGETFVAMPEKDSPEARQSLVSACQSIGFRPDIRYEAAEPSIVLKLVASGVGLAIVQESFSKVVTEGVVLRPLPDEFPMRIRIYLVSREDPNPLATRFIELQRATD